MTARELFKGKKAQGKVLVVNKGGYRGNDFAYRICDCNLEYVVEVISPVNPREYSVPKFRDGQEVPVQNIENAILYNEYVSRVHANKQKGLQ